MRVLAALICVALLAASAPADDVETLVRRARVRLEHGNEEGARELLVEALRLRPDDHDALELIAPIARHSPGKPAVRYLLTAQPLDLPTARRVLEGWAMAAPSIVWQPESTEVERESLSPEGLPDLVYGPLPPGEPPGDAPPYAEACGPLRLEALGDARTRGLETCLAIAARFDRDGIAETMCRIHLARVLWSYGEKEAAATCLQGARRESVEERLRLANAVCSMDLEWGGFWSGPDRELVRALSDPGVQVPHEQLVAFVTWGMKRAVEQKDLDALVALGHLRTGTYLQIPYEFLNAVETFVPLDEACAALEGREDGPARWARGEMLFFMQQGDRACELLEETVRDHPDCWPAWQTLLRHYHSMWLPVDAQRCAERLLDGMVEGGLAFDWEVISTLLRLAELRGGHRGALEVTRNLLGRTTGAGVVGTLSSYWQTARTADMPVTETFFPLLEADGSRALEFSWLLYQALIEGRSDLALDILDHLTPEAIAGIPYSFLAASPLSSLLPVLRAIASEATPTPQRDRFLRETAAPHCRARWPEVIVRLRMELESDPGFMRLPGAAYVLWTMTDARLEADREQRLRRQAYAAGSRTLALLRSMARGGEDVLEDLARIDPTEALLVRALRAPGTELLEPFLQVDEADGEQVTEAREALRRRRGVEGLLRERAGWISNEAYYPSGHSRPETPRSEPPPSLAGLAQAVPTETKEWRAAAISVLERGGPDAMETLLEAPLGARIAMQLKDDTRVPAKCDFIGEVRRQAERHPEDLRWRWVLGTREDWEALIAARRGTPAVLFWAARACPEAISNQEAVERYIDMHRSHPVLQWGEGIVERVKAAGDPRWAEKTLERVLALCRDDRERNLLAWMASQVGCPDFSARTYRAVATAGSGHERFMGIWWARRAGAWPRDPQTTAALAREDGWTGTDGRSLWVYALEDALAAGVHAIAMEAVEALWRLGPGHAMDAVEGRPCDPAQALSRPEPVIDLLDAEVAAGRATPAVRLLQWSLIDVGRDARPRSRELADAMYDAGFISTLRWPRWVLDSGCDAPRACEAYLASLGEGSDTQEAERLLLYELWTGLVSLGRRREAADCVDIWATRCGAVQYDSSGIGSSRGWYALDATDEDDIETWSSFDDLPIPERALAALVLEGLGLFDEAEARIAAEAGDLPRGPLRDECLRVLSAMRISDTRGADRLTPSPCRGDCDRQVVDPAARAVLAAEALLTLRSETRDPALYREAHRALVRLWNDFPSVRPCFVEVLLAEHAGGPLPLPEEVSAWEARLGAADPSIRQEAEEALRAEGEAALPLLRALCRTEDPEVKARVESILADLTRP